jgi:hypothetical protein
LPYPLALPALFLAAGLAAFEAEVFETEVLAVTGARALEVASVFGLAADFLAATFFAGLAVAASASGFSTGDFSTFDFAAFSGFAALAGLAAFLAPRLEPPPLAARSSISAIASGSVMVSSVLSLGMVALMPPAVT